MSVETSSQNIYRYLAINKCMCACMLWGVVEIDIIYYDEEDRDFNSLFIALITSENIKL